MDINSSLELELLDDYIDSKALDLSEIYNLSNQLIKKYDSFVNDYNNKIKELNELITKKSEEIHNLLNSFEYIYNESLNELNDKNNKLLLDSNFNSEESKLILAELHKKLQSERDKLNNDFKASLERLNNEYKNGKDTINKINKKLDKLKSKDLKEVR